MTPGPWTFGYLRECPAVLGPDGEPVTTSMENAHLIAAAPDLLEALKRLRAIVTTAGTEHERSLADAAIAKAEGRS